MMEEKEQNKQYYAQQNKHMTKQTNIYSYFHDRETD